MVQRTVSERKPTTLNSEVHLRLCAWTFGTCGTILLTIDVLVESIWVNLGHKFLWNAVGRRCIECTLDAGSRLIVN